MKKSSLKIVLGIILFVISVIFVLLNPLQIVQWKISDLFFRPGRASDLITIIAIDEKSISPDGQLGRFRDWPRSYYSQLLRAIAPHNPVVVAYDLDFREASRGMSHLRIQQLLRDYERKIANTPGAGYSWYEFLKRFEGAGEGHPDDSDFQTSMNEAKFPVVLVSSLIFEESEEEGSTPLTGEFPKVKSVIPPLYKGENVTAGFVNSFRDRDGVLRRFAAWADGVPGFSTAIANAYWSGLSGGASGRATDVSDIVEGGQQPPGGSPQNGTISISYSTRPFQYRMLSFTDVLAGKFDKRDMEGKIVMIGATARSLQDFQTTPTSKNRMAGVEVNANLVQQILEMKLLKEQGKFSLILLLAVLTLGGSFLFLTLGLRSVIIIFGVVLLAYPGAAWALYQTGTVLNVVYPELAWIFTGLAALWVRNQTEFREKRLIQKAFSHYVSPIVVGELVKHPESLKLGGTRRQISVMFSDIVGFTSLAERLTPEDTVALLNDYLTSMTEIIFEHHGTLDKYQGDAVMALFGAPLDDEHHAVNACVTALGMRQALVALHEKWNAIPSLPFKDQLVRLDFRVGIATGPAVVGNVGSERRFDYTAIGDIVNLGSRLESVNRKYGTRVIVDKNTFVTVTENHNPFLFRKLDQIRVKGKQEVTEIFEVLGFAQTATSELKAGLDDFENGRILYMQRNFIDAKQYFEAVLARLPEDGPSQIYKNRCNFFLRKPPSREWDGVVNLEEK